MGVERVNAGRDGCEDDNGALSRERSSLHSFSVNTCRSRRSYGPCSSFHSSKMEESAEQQLAAGTHPEGDAPHSTRPAGIQAVRDRNRLKFETELEFVQSLANPFYLQCEYIATASFLIQLFFAA